MSEAHFRSWAETTECDGARSLNLLGQTVQALGGALVNGDALTLPMWLPRADSQWSTRLMMVESDRLSTPPMLLSSPNVRGGIEFDQYGAPEAYHIMRQHPGDARSLLGVRPGMNVWDRVPAFMPWLRRRVIHPHDKERTGESRGKPIVSAVMAEFHMVGKYAKNELQAQALHRSNLTAPTDREKQQVAAATTLPPSPWINATMNHPAQHRKPDGLRHAPA